MAIVNMTKFSLFSFAESRKELIDELQRFEYIHFSDTKDIAEEQNLQTVEVPKSIEDNDRELSRVKWILDVLKPREEKQSKLASIKEGLKWYTIDELKEKGSQVEYDSLYDELKSHTIRIDEIDQEIKYRQGLINELIPWLPLESEISDLSSTPTVKVLTGTIPTKKLSDVSIALEAYDGMHFEAVSEVKNNTYIVALVLNEQYNDVIEVLRQNSFNNVTIPGSDTAKVETENHEAAILSLTQEKEEVNSKINANTKRIDDIELAYEYLSNQKLELSSMENFIGLKEVDIVNGYIPTDMVLDFEKSIKKILGNGYYLELADAEKSDDTTPVLLKNNKLVEPFQSITEMYSTPVYSEIDPTPFLSIFYWVFFGMMVADLGYGAVLFALTGIALAKFNLTDKMRSSVKFFFMLSISTMIWGLIYGSVFGMSLPFHLIDTGDNIKLLILSIIFGAIHLFFGLALKGYMLLRDGKVKDAIYDVLFWYMALIGLTLFLLGIVGVIPTNISSVGKWVMIVGMIGIVLFGGRDAKSVPSRLAQGAYELYGISSWVGDFVSYSRLMALGLSGGFIAMAINMMIGMLPKNPIGMILGVVIFLGGHAFNIFLSYLSAYVHDIRLSYVEFFGKFFTGSGKVFNVFKNDTKYINIK